MTAKRFGLFGQWHKSDSKKNSLQEVHYFSLYRYASSWDLFVIFLGIFFTFCKALTLPWVVIVYGEFTSLLVERNYGSGTSSPTLMLKWFGGGRILTNASIAENQSEIINDSIAYGILSLIATLWHFIFGIFCVDCFNRTAIRQITRIRTKYFESLIRQDIGWYDVAGGKTNFSVRITEDIEKIKSGLAEDVSHFLNLMFSFVMCVVISFIYGWKLTLIVVSYLPLVFATNIFIGKLQAAAAERELNAYAVAAFIVEEALSGIRTVLAFGGEKVEVDRYTERLEPAKRAAIRKGLFSSVSDSVTRLLFFASSALSFWIGVQWVLNDRDKLDKEYTPASLLIILCDFNLTIETGETVALVGFSGNGKSTCLQLLQRFYDPVKGDVLLDGHSIASLNIESLRSCIATVGQEPVLFSTIIAENIRYGNPQATDEEVTEAAKSSGAHEFIMKLTNQYETMVGSNGSQLSGGQRQRISIARALVQNPKILLLDESTSALDYQSEKLVQRALDSASKGRTTIIVSHRLSAIRGADRVLFIEKGQIVEEGTHKQLVEKKGRYYDMVKMQEPNKKNKNKPKTQRQMGRKISVKEKTLSDSESESGTESESDTESDKEDERYKDNDEVKYMENFMRILRLAKQDWISLFSAICSAFIVGSAFPLFSLVFAEVYGALSVPDANEALDQVFMWCVVFLGLGVFIFIGALNQTYFFTKAGANLTQRIRSTTFESMLSQECGWFDDQNNAVGALGSRLSGDAANLQTAIGYPFSLILQAISTFATGILISFFASIKLSLICLASVPILLVAVFYEARYLSKSTVSEKEAMAAATQIASESISNIRTVASLRQEKFMIQRFVVEMDRVERLGRKKIIFRGLVNSFSQAIPLMAYGVALCYGGFMVAYDEIHYKEIVRVSEAMLYGTLFMCDTLVFAPTITTAFIGAHGVFKIIDRKSMIISIKQSVKLDESNNIDFKSINFHYPTRPNIQVLNEFNLRVHEGKTVALVGHSGSGKSTCIQLLQRLYDPQDGNIHIGQSDKVEDLSLNDLRSKLSIVSQEPVLFKRSIAENIAYGDNTREVLMQEIIEAAKVANVHKFIIQLPEGYETNVGSKATQLSGGQKQRIAIARALIRNPKILLLDEATSALDLQSEVIVQEALDSARSGRTCIVIAHRLSTIENADIICVVQNGSIVESGTHTDLLALNKYYAQLYNAQK